MKKILFLGFLFLTSAIFSQDIPNKKTQTAFGQIDYLSINMPNDINDNPEVNMGFTGLHYILDFEDFYTGLGLYGTVSGRRGGFFTLGLDFGYKKYLTDKLYTDIGFHFGGGGGAGAPDGGGAFILPHTNLGYDFKNFSITAGWSYINFFDGGGIKSHQLNVGVRVPLNYEYSDYKNLEKAYALNQLKSSKWNQKSNKMVLALQLNNLIARGSTQLTDGNSLKGTTIRLAGFEINPYFSENAFYVIKFDGAFDGISGGYMDVFLGAGYNFSLIKNSTNLITKFSIGAGGGGGADTLGGFLIQPDISLEQRIFDNIFLAANVGYMMSPNSFFSTSTYGISLKYHIDVNGIVNDTESQNSAKFKGFETVIKHDIYLNAKRDFNPTENLHQISVQLNFMLNKNIYLAGQTSFANFGNAGAYAEGIVGVGLKSNPILKDKVQLFIQALGGASGGGDISIGQGFIVKPSTGFTYKLNENLDLRSSVGYVKAAGGNLSSTTFNFGLSYKFSFLNLK